MNSLPPIPHWLAPWAVPLLQAGAAAAILVVVVLAGRSLGRRHVPVRWWYALGLLAMLRLALPIVPACSLGLRWTLGSAPAPATPEVPAVAAIPLPALPVSPAPPAEPAPPAPLAPPPVLAAADFPAAVEIEAAPVPDLAQISTAPPVAPIFLPDPEPPPPPPQWSALVPTAAGWLWLAGSLAVLGRALGQSLRFARRVRRFSTRADASVQDLAATVSASAGLRRRPVVLELPHLPGPLSCGALRPVILLPAGLAATLTAPELRHILCHECIHLRHRDSLLNWALLSLCALHWFNPAAWLCRRALLADRELLRDAAALRLLHGSTTPADYGRTLLRLATFPIQPAPAPGLTAFLTSEKQIHRRITMITHPITTPRRLTTTLAALTSSIALVGLFTQAPAQDAPAADPPVVPTANPVLPSPSPSAAAALPGADPSPRSEIDRLRSEVTGLREELTTIRSLIEKSPSAPTASLEQQLIQARVDLEMNRTELASNHPKVQAAERKLETLEKLYIVQKEKTEMDQNDMRAGKAKSEYQKNQLVKKLIRLKSDTARLETNLQLLTTGNAEQMATDFPKRAELSTLLGDNRAQIVEIETRLQYGVID